MVRIRWAQGCSLSPGGKGSKGNGKGANENKTSKKKHRKGPKGGGKSSTK